MANGNYASFKKPQEIREQIANLFIELWQKRLTKEDETKKSAKMKLPKANISEQYIQFGECIESILQGIQSVSEESSDYLEVSGVVNKLCVLSLACLGTYRTIIIMLIALRCCI
jgi:hypothetical protein